MSAIPTINVNLKKCTCKRVNGRLPHIHDDACDARPVLIPCPIPRSVKFRVVLGECTCLSEEEPPEVGGIRTAEPGHFSNCPARPVEVVCSISGETWAGSAVADVEHAITDDRILGDAGMRRGGDVARDRWSLFRMLVTNTLPAETQGDLVRQRDALFSALADMAREEQAAFESQERAIQALGDPTFVPDNFHRAEPHSRASACILEHWVERTIKQVGILP
jgi:hypothetical protein